MDAISDSQKELIASLQKREKDILVELSKPNPLQLELDNIRKSLAFYKLVELGSMLLGTRVRPLVNAGGTKTLRQRVIDAVCEGGGDLSTDGVVNVIQAAFPKETREKIKKKVAPILSDLKKEEVIGATGAGSKTDPYKWFEIKKAA